MTSSYLKWKIKKTSEAVPTIVFQNVKSEDLKVRQFLQVKKRKTLPAETQSAGGGGDQSEEDETSLEENL